ncbi:C39 family peptidase [Microcoleus sp. herbarium7]|uniref:C39 family peptidase n=1 Tax=Microcoleus sp. herbarium7 TaxID=3055435 RepID=UPI002FD443BD
MTIQANVNTLLKRTPSDSRFLTLTDKLPIKTGEAFQIKTITPDRDQHAKVIFANPVQGWSEAYIYQPHWTLPTSSNILLMAPYFSQLDNDSGQGNRECCGTSNAIMLNFLLAKAKVPSLVERAFGKGIEPETVYFDTLAKYGDTTDHGANTQALQEFGIESQWATNLSLEDLLKSLRAGIPLVMGLHYKRWGHIVCAIGYNFDRNAAIVHDPFGARAGDSDNWAATGGDSGKADIYSDRVLQSLWCSGQSDGWGRIVTSVLGKPTGLK